MSHQQSFSYVGTVLPGSNQYYARINVSCSRTQPTDTGEAGPAAPQSRVKHSTTKPLRSLQIHVLILVKFNQFILKILSGNKILTSVKGHNSNKCAKKNDVQHF